MIALRRATAGDVDAIRSLVHAAYVRWVPLMGIDPIPMLADYEKAIADHVIDLHDVGPDLAALIEMRPAPDHLFVVNVAVSPAFQKRGLGRAMMDHAERVANGLSLGETRLLTNKVMVENIRLYENLGYHVDREEAFRGGFVLTMSKRL